jgi:2-C-methyl-D-erythritol 4-phosphate cytidylyltransferase/2-C-methyl-D-erythritol 2,4-cyclodiphosphate synthase
MKAIVGVLVAAGRSRRMGADKLWIDLWGRPAWRWSLDALLAVPELTRVAVVVPADAEERFRAALPADESHRCLLVVGGEERVDSALAGIAALARAGASDATVVLVHDAARPAATTDLMARVAAAVTPRQGAIPAIPVHDALKQVDPSGRMLASLDREGVVVAQTPQAATIGTMRSALEEARAWGRSVVDEAAALAGAGIPVVVVDGERGNIKLTEPSDEPLVRGGLLASAVPLGAPPVEAGQRSGIGFDAHRFEPGRILKLGGVLFDGEDGLAGHSDGDVALHAAVDALLGATIGGDIGTLFPPTDARWENADSGALLQAAVRLVADAGWRPVSLDVAVVARRPAVAPRRDEMEWRIAALVGIPSERVTVKATTSDGLGFAGDEGIAAFAVAVAARA